uniref:Uncharacterized protein n=1 Tax=Cannabis sativa TaxID=3483 RepID=A0A803PBI3_CANSA
MYNSIQEDDGLPELLKELIGYTKRQAPKDDTIAYALTKLASCALATKANFVPAQFFKELSPFVSKGTNMLDNQLGYTYNNIPLNNDLAREQGRGGWLQGVQSGIA